MPFARRSRIKVEIRLPGIMIGTDDVGALFKRGPDAGPFLISSRTCGLALDTGLTTDSGNKVVMWPTHGRRHQLWFLRPSGHNGEVLVISADSGLALDAGVKARAGEALILWEPHGEPWQRWTLDEAPDGAGYFLGSAVNGHVLSASDEAEPGWSPWLTERDAAWDRQWLLSIPHGHGMS